MEHSPNKNSSYESKSSIELTQDDVVSTKNEQEGSRERSQERAKEELEEVRKKLAEFSPEEKRATLAEEPAQETSEKKEEIKKSKIESLRILLMSTTARRRFDILSSQFEINYRGEWESLIEAANAYAKVAKIVSRQVLAIIDKGERVYTASSEAYRWNELAKDKKKAQALDTKISFLLAHNDTSFFDERNLSSQGVENVLERIPFEVLKLACENPLIKITHLGEYYFNLEEEITLENINKIHSLFPHIKELEAREVHYFLNEFSQLSEKRWQLAFKLRKTFSFHDENVLNFFKSITDTEAETIDEAMRVGVLKPSRYIKAGELEEIIKLGNDNIHKFARLGYTLYELLVFRKEFFDDVKTLTLSEIEFVLKIHSKNTYRSFEFDLDEAAQVKKYTGEEQFFAGYEFIKTLTSSGWFIQGITFNTAITGLANVNEKQLQSALKIVEEEGVEIIQVAKALSQQNIHTFVESVVTCIEKLNRNPQEALLENPLNSFKQFSHIQEWFTNRGINFSQNELAVLFDAAKKTCSDIGFWGNNQTIFFDKRAQEFPFTLDQYKEVVELLVEKSPFDCFYMHFDEFENYLNKSGVDKQPYYDRVFEWVKENRPHLFFSQNSFPYTAEQQRFVSLIRKINQSPSREMKNLASSIAMLISQEDTIENGFDKIEQIERIFLRNNLPFVGKQYKIFEILYPGNEIGKKLHYNSSPVLKGMPNDRERKYQIFRDLVRINIDSLHFNLEEYLLALQDGQDLLNAYEKGIGLSDEDLSKLQLFLRKIAMVSESIGRPSSSHNEGNDSLEDQIEDLRAQFGVKEGETIIEKFERTFLRRVGIESIEEALTYIETKREEIDQRNKVFAGKGTITVSSQDLIKAVHSQHVDEYLSRGIYSPEFIGAESESSVRHSLQGDSTPWDTDVLMIGERSLSDIHLSTYGDVMIIIRNRDQFDGKKKELIHTKVISENHYGIRTGVASTEIDAFVLDNNDIDNDRKVDGLKFSIAKKGFYIPICNKKGEVIFTYDEFEKFKHIFDGVKKYHGERLSISDEWQSTSLKNEIQSARQTKENLERITVIKDKINGVIIRSLEENGIQISKGAYSDSVLGASILDTGSTGRGVALDNGYDFDFVVKLDDIDMEKATPIIACLKTTFTFTNQYVDQSGMIMCRAKEVDVNGAKVELDIGFVAKSNTESFDTNTALEQKYDSIRKEYGEEKWLQVLTNIRYAKQQLKKAECYKKGIHRDQGQQGGLGGIGVEHWVLQHEGDFTKACKAFCEAAYQNGELIPFDQFKHHYKIFSAGENIRNNMRAENFTYNMDVEGYQKMAQMCAEVTNLL